MDAVVCGTCGSDSRRHLIVKCARCNASEHCYCMEVLMFKIPREWYCAGCQEYADRCPNPSQGGKTELQKPCHGCDKMKERETGKHLSHSNVAHQINPRSSLKFENAKVKFISSEEVALLNRERPSYVRSRFAHPSSPPNTKHSPNLKCISPSRSDTQVQALKRCAAASHDQTKIEDSSYFVKQQKQVHPASPSSMKQLSNMKAISPSRSDMQVQALKRCAAASRDQAKIEDRADFAQSQVRLAPPPHVKQLSNMKCITPNRTEMQVHDMKRCASASPNQSKFDDVNMKEDTRSGGSMLIIRRCRTSEKVKVKLDSLFEDKAREVKIVNADKAEINSEIEDGPRENRASCASGGGTGSKYEMENLNQHRDVLISIDPSMEYTRRPPPKSCWEGCFLVSDAGANLNLGSFKAQFPSKVLSKVYDIVEKLPDDLELELLPRMNDWPKSFETSGPVYEDIGLFFFPNEPDGHEKKHCNLLEASDNYVLRAYIKGTSTKLLIYSSEVLPHDSQWIDGESYLWGVFVRLKGKGDPRQFGSSTT